MKVLHITHRYGKEIYGGAEIHYRNISEGLAKKGVQVAVCTTKTKDLKSLFRSSTLFDNELSDEYSNGVLVHRFFTKNPNRSLSYLFERLYEWQLNREENAQLSNISSSIMNNTTERGGFLLTGWNNVERYNGRVMRWTKKEASFVIHDDLVNKISIFVENKAGIEITINCNTNGKSISTIIGPFLGSREINMDLPQISGKILVRIICNHSIKFSKDHRILGVFVSSIKYQTNNGELVINMEEDYRHHLIRYGEYLPYLIQNAQSRPKFFSWMFDYMRGPNSKAMKKWLKKNIQYYDVILAQMYPFNTMKYALEAKKHKIPLVFLPLMHIDDEFYHWSHYYSILKESDIVLANSNYSNKHFFERLNINSNHIGPGIDPSIFLKPSISGDRFRCKYNFGSQPIVLTVSRKNPGKKYDMIIRAMKGVREKIYDAVLVMIGPDDDNIQYDEEFFYYLGRVDEEILADAYDACNVFAMMSESESFGMVFCEAWSRKKPVIGNKHCGAVSSLIDHENDGILCSNEDELIDALSRLLLEPNISSKMGNRGFEKVMKSYTWDTITEKINMIYTNLLQQKGQ